MKKATIVVCLLLLYAASAGAKDFPLVTAGRTTVIYTDASDYALVQKTASLFQKDLQLVTGQLPVWIHSKPVTGANLVIIGSLDGSPLLQQLVSSGKLNVAGIAGKWEGFVQQVVLQPFPGVAKALVIAGSDRRGTAYGAFELSRKIGVSPWYWWADVPVVKKKMLMLAPQDLVTDLPAVKYRGFFINDEAPALSGWSKDKFGGFNHLFYEKVFELLLRLKANYLWPAMWGNAFYDDDSLNMQAADEYGIVIGTSHHEPLMRAHAEWKRYGNGLWNYDSNEVRLQAFWKEGMVRATNEKIVSIGMRGDGDEPMSAATATALLERIVKDQRSIIEQVTRQPAAATPQLWALYKEVQDYYDKGMRVPDDVTLLLCDDNWGNIRKLPKLNEPNRKGGYGVYYHFDYVGDPRNYKWINTNPIARIWEQMHLAWEYNARQIWIVNVGDIKPMEFPLSFFLDYAWNPTKTGAGDLQLYTRQWAAAQFGRAYAEEIAAIITAYTKYNGRRKPELLDADTYKLEHYNEAARVTQAYTDLVVKAEKINNALPAIYRDAYFQLVLHPVKAGANLQQLYTAVALNRQLAAQKNVAAKQQADKARYFYRNDSLLSLQYHTMAHGKWNHMMDQTHIGYTYWQQPPVNKMPDLLMVPAGSTPIPFPAEKRIAATALPLVPAGKKGNIFYEKDGYVSIAADHYTKAVAANGITWAILPDHGRTGNALTAFPVTAPVQVPTASSPHVVYEVYLYDTGAIKLDAYFSPTLNFQHTPDGLQYAISIDDETPQVVSINREDSNVQAWSEWVANNITICSTQHDVVKPGKHLVQFWMISPAVVLQQLVLDFGGVKKSYLGPPETKI